MRGSRWRREAQWGAPPPGGTFACLGGGPPLLQAPEGNKKLEKYA
jgi:hypothetical protein